MVKLQKNTWIKLLFDCGLSCLMLKIQEREIMWRPSFIGIELFFYLYFHLYFYVLLIYYHCFVFFILWTIFTLIYFRYRRPWSLLFHIICDKFCEESSLDSYFHFCNSWLPVVKFVFWLVTSYHFIIFFAFSIIASLVIIYLYFSYPFLLFRMYGKFMSYRSYIRKAISQVFFRYIYETGRYVYQLGLFHLIVRRIRETFNW